MTRPRQTRTRRSGWRRVRRWLCLCCLIVLVVGVLVILFLEPLLNTSLAKSVLLKQLEKRSGLEWSVERVVVDLPWIVGLEGLQAQQSSSEEHPVFTAQSITLTLQKRTDRLSVWPKRVEISQPKGRIPIQLISTLAKRSDITWTDNTAPDEQQGRTPVAPPIDRPQSSQTKRPTAAVQEQSAPDPAPPVAEREPVGPTVDVVISEGEFTIVDEKDESELWKIKGLSVNMPLGGEDRAGEIVWDELSVIGNVQPGKGQIDLQWARPWLNISESDGEFYGLNYLVAARATPKRGGVFSGRLEIPDQSWAIPELGLSVSQLRGNSRFGGMLQNRATWSGVSGFKCEGVSLLDPVGGEKIEFYEGKASVSANAYGMSLDDALLLGETTLLRGNGVALRNGAVGAAVRLLSGPNDSESLNRFARQYGLTDDRPWMGPSPTPDLWMRELRITGVGSRLWINALNKDEWVELGAVLSSARN